jgi:hypothetical protein
MPSDQSVIYKEWQYPRIASFLPLVMLPPAVWLVGAPFSTNIGAIIGIAVAVLVALLKIKNSGHIEITATSVRLGEASIPRSAIGKAAVINEQNQFFERGAKLDSRAFTFLKYGLPGMVKIEISDKSDSTPYLLVSTRDPEALVKALG